MVSIITITYNQAKYIADTIEGVLLQEVNFPIEFFIADDCSSDETENVVLSFIENHPRGHWIKYTKHNINKGMNQNFVWALNQCKGKYIALCEGDDYWTDPLKLQKQVDFLEANPDYGICFHSVNLIHPDGTITDDNITKVPEKYQTIKDLASKGNYIHTPTVMFANKKLVFPKEFHFSPLGDFFLYMLLSRNSKIAYLKQKMAVYRLKSGFWSNKLPYERNLKTSYTFALLVKTKLFDNEINNILINRILSVINRFIELVNSKDIEAICILPEIRVAIDESFLHEIRNQRRKSNQSLQKRLMDFLKLRLKSLRT